MSSDREQPLLRRPSRTRRRRAGPAGRAVRPGRIRLLVVVAPGRGPDRRHVYVTTASGAFFAFTNWSGIGSFDFIGITNFVKHLPDPRAARRAHQHAGAWPSGSSCSRNVIGLLFALALNRTLKTRYLLRTLIFMPVVLSPVAVSFVWKFIFAYDGPLNQILGAVGLKLAAARTGSPSPSSRCGCVLVVHGLADHRLRHGDLPGRPRHRPARARGGGGARRRRDLAPVPQRHAADDPALDRHRHHPDPDPGPARVRPGHGPDRRRSRTTPPRPSRARSTSRPSPTSSSASAPPWPCCCPCSSSSSPSPSRRSPVTAPRSEPARMFRYTRAHPRPRDRDHHRRADAAGAVLDPDRRRVQDRRPDADDLRPSLRRPAPRCRTSRRCSPRLAAQSGNICAGPRHSVLITAGRSSP